MRRAIASLVLVTCSSTVLLAQDPAAAKELSAEGVRLHDEGTYEEAVKKFDAALKKDKNNFYAMAEKANTLEAMGRYEECIAMADQAILLHGANEEVSMLYLAKANALDKLKRPEEALAVYKRGQEVSPTEHQLWYNEGVTLAGMGRTGEAKASFEHAMRLAPGHASSHNALGRLEQKDKHRIPALMALSRCLILEPEGQRARGNLSLVKELMKGSAEKTGANTVTVTIDPALLPAKGDTAHNKEDDFTSAELIIDMMSALDLSEENKSKQFVELFQEKFDSVCAVMDETKAGQYGFFWEYYAPYFVALKKAGHLEAAVMVMHRSSAATGVQNWLMTNKEAVTAFEEWTAAYAW
ncbi:MAG: tetratricopeptide repeat protein [Flavobacteriales bacterium]